MKKHVGSSFDEFLADEGLLSEAEATAVTVIAYQLSRTDRSVKQRQQS